MAHPIHYQQLHLLSGRDGGCRTKKLKVLVRVCKHLLFAFLSLIHVETLFQT